MKNKKLAYHCVVVEWIDSAEPYPNAEIIDSEIPEPQKIFQCGFLLRDETDYISIGGAYKPGSEMSFDYVISIPKFAVQSIRKLA